MFRITGGKGFQMDFENGVTISVQFGWANYHDNRVMFPKGDYDEVDRQLGEQGSPNAEIAIMRGDDWFDFGGDTVKGWVTPDEVADWITFAKNIGPNDILNTRQP